MTKETEETLISAKNAYKSTLELYRKLGELEINNLQITEEYYQTLVKLNSSVKLSKEIISKLFNNPKEIGLLFKNLIEKIVENGDDISALITDNEDKIIAIRIAEELREFLLNNTEELSNLELKEQLSFNGIELEDSMDILENETFEKLKSQTKSECLISKSFQTDINMLFIILLNKKIENERNKRIKRDLIKIKYSKIFITPQIEEDLLNKAFYIPSEIYLSTYFTRGIYNIDYKVLENIINMNKMLIYNSIIYNLIPKSSVYVSKTELELYLREIQLRTILSFYTKDEIMDANEEFHDAVDSLNESYFGDTIEAVTKAFKAYNKDQTLIKKITLG